MIFKIIQLIKIKQKLKLIMYSFNLLGINWKKIKNFKWKNIFKKFNLEKISLNH